MPTAHIHITLKQGLYDAQGSTVRRALHQLGHNAVQDVHIGKYITLNLDNSLPADEMQHRLDLMCQQLLANPVIENYEIAFEDEVPESATPLTPIKLSSPVRPTARVSAINPQVSDPKTPGGVSINEPFALDYNTYNSLPMEEKLSLRSMAWQKHGAWMMQQLNEREAEWVCCVGGEVIDSGTSLDTYPNEERLTQLGQANDLVPWVFTRPPA
jgi:phosphoribosylformylglycinamidine synthase